MEFEGKVAIVTGGVQGIGQSYCSILLKKRMKVCICDIKELPMDFTQNMPVDCVESLMYQKCDVTSAKDIKNAFEEVLRKFGRIDLIVNNAGIVNEKDWEKVIAVNFIAVIHGIQLGLEYMSIDKGGFGGCIVNTGSNTAFQPFPLGPVYSGCKHGVIGLTKSYGSDYHLKKTGVKVCAVCPGPTDTELFRNFPEMILDTEEGKKANSKVKTIKPEEVAKGLIKVLEDGKNGCLLLVDEDGMRYVDFCNL